MFKKKKQKNSKFISMINDKITVTENETIMTKKTHGNVIPSIISSDMQITGNIVSSGEIQFDGIIEGNVKAEKVIVTENAVINGDVNASSLEIRGEINGIISVETLLLSSTAKVVGDITYVTMDIERGALFEGRSSISEKKSGNGKDIDFSDVSLMLNEKKNEKQSNKTVRVVKA